LGVKIRDRLYGKILGVKMIKKIRRIAKIIFGHGIGRKFRVWHMYY
jgi:hypothetical protein